MHKAEKDVVAKGTWLYDGTTLQPVFIVRLNYDFWYELGKDENALEDGEESCLNENGFRYYVSFQGIRVDGSFWPDSLGDMTIEAAKATAQSKVPSAVSWEGNV